MVKAALAGDVDKLLEGDHLDGLMRIAAAAPTSCASGLFVAIHRPA
jgi:hypothetical protein